MNVNEIRKFLSHRYPFLLVDKVLDFNKNKSLTAIKNVSINEPFFQGHFPDYPVMPGVLILEALAQASSLPGFKKMLDDYPDDETLCLLVGMDKARFKRQVVPGDVLTLKVELLKKPCSICKFYCRALVDDELAASANIMCTAARKPEK